MSKDKRSFFERITGSISVNEEETPTIEEKYTPNIKATAPKWKDADEEEEDEAGELSVDVYQTETEIVVQSMIAGVKPEHLNISITREMISIEGRRERPSEADLDNYFIKELYWGVFVRKILLPGEVEPAEAEAYEKNGLLTLRVPKVDKDKTQKIKVRSL